jgi:tetratricopeptide (TPR) repeat protein
MFEMYGRIAAWPSTCLLAVCIGLAVLAAGELCRAQTASDAELAAQSVDYFRKGDCDNAVPLLTSLLEHEPKNVASRKLLAKCLLEQKKWEKAHAQFEWVMRDSPKDLDALEGSKAALVELQKVEQTAQKRVFETRATTTEQLRSKHELDDATDLIRAGKLGEAEQQLKAIIAQHPDWTAPRQRLAEVYSATNRFVEAAEIYRSLSTAVPTGGAEFLRRAAQNYEWAEKYDDAAKCYRLFLKHIPGNATARLSLALILVRDAQYQEAIPELRRVLEQRPTSLQAQLVLAQCYERLQDPERALQAYDRVLQLDPGLLGAAAARERLRRYLDELPLRRGYEAVDRRDWSGAIQAFSEYLAKHPTDMETILRIARIYSVNQDFANARALYDKYLDKNPNDFAIRRELASRELWAQNYAGARRQLQRVITDTTPTAADYENLIHACVWGNDPDAAEPYAQQLAKLQPDNALALQTLRGISDRRKYEARQRIDRLVLERRFAEAINATREYMAAYGGDPSSQAQICRLYSWGRDFGRAASCYHEYLINSPDDNVARLELADIENWSGKYAEAAVQYGKVLQADPKKTAALLGLAQTMDNRKADPIQVENAYREVLHIDPTNSLARERVEAIHSLVAPTLEISHSSFSNTDDLYWAVNSVAISITTPGRVKFSPYYTSGYFQQQRSIPGTTPAVVELNKIVSSEDGIVLANGGGLRIDLAPSPHWAISADAGALHFDTGRTSPTGHADLVYRPSSRQSWGISYQRRDAIFDLWTLATVVSGIVGDTVLISSSQVFGEKLRLSVQGGFASYSRGTAEQFPSSTQRRLWAQLDYPVRSWLRIGYVHRLSSFTSTSPIYFSPELYQTHGLSYAIERAINDRLRFTNSGELAYSRIDAHSNFEISTLPAITWKIGAGFVLDLGYRFSLGRTSAFGLPTYRTQGGEVRLRKVF